MKKPSTKVSFTCRVLGGHDLYHDRCMINATYKYTHESTSPLFLRVPKPNPRLLQLFEPLPLEGFLICNLSPACQMVHPHRPQAILSFWGYAIFPFPIYVLFKIRNL